MRGQHQPLPGYGFGEMRDGARPRCGQPHPAQVGPRQSGGVREAPTKRPVCAFEGVAEALDQPPRQRGGPGHRDLLAEDGAHRDLEAVPGARNAQARTHEGPQPGVATQMGTNGSGVCVQVEQAPRVCGQAGDAVGQVGGHAQHEVAFVAGVAHLDHPGLFGRARHASIHAAVGLANFFHTG